LSSWKNSDINRTVNKGTMNHKRGTNEGDDKDVVCERERERERDAHTSVYNEGVSKSFRAKSIMKYTLTFGSTR
jgi:hypothetical protein